MMSPNDKATIKRLAEVRAAILAIDGTIHPLVVVGSVGVLAQFLSVQSNRVSVKTKDALVALIAAVMEEYSDG